jgi:hypothetical protein
VGNSGLHRAIDARKSDTIPEYRPTASTEVRMRLNLHRAVAPLALALFGCGGNGDAVADDLAKDLAASSVRIELAGSNAQPMRFVSELEQVQQAEPVQRQRTPRHVAAKTADDRPDENLAVAPESQQELQVAEAPAPEAQAPAPEETVSAVPSVAPRPVALPVDVPTEGISAYGRAGSGRGTDGGGGIGIGDVIGVVIRGGGTGPDHCPPPRRRPRGRGFPINPIVSVVVPQAR